MSVDHALLDVEVELAQQNRCFDGPVAEVCQYAIEGGRRVRASLLLGTLRQPDQRALLAATALEMLHAATLLQDDIFDSGRLRRGRPTAHVTFGKALATLASDCLLIRSLELAADVDPVFFRSLARAGRAMAVAESWELASPELASMTQARALDLQIARGKTATLFAAALGAAALLKDLPADCCQQWEHLGMELGMTYQFLDDCVDVLGDPTASGKTSGCDLAAGRLTLPILYGVATLHERHIELPLPTLQAGRLRPDQMQHLEAALASPEARMHLRSLVQERLVQHETSALQLGTDAPFLTDWLAALGDKLSACLPATPCRFNDAQDVGHEAPLQVWQNA